MSAPRRGRAPGRGSGSAALAPPSGRYDALADGVRVVDDLLDAAASLLPVVARGNGRLHAAVRRAVPHRPLPHDAARDAGPDHHRPLRSVAPNLQLFPIYG